MSTALVSFKYDPFGRRIDKSSSSGMSIYAYDGDNLIEETNSSGVARYSQTQNIDEPLAMLRSGATSYFHADSFGKLTASTGSLVNPFQYTARESDSETGLNYYRARYYDPQSGRFLREDPMGPNEGPNLYTYVSNNPVTNADPSGRFKIDQSCKGRCQAFGGGGPNNPNKPATNQSLEEVIQQQADFACSNLQGITDPKLKACIQKSCDKGTIKCKGNGDKNCQDAGGYGGKFLFLTSRTANLCPNNWPPWTSALYVGGAVIHEFAHGCGWQHGQGGGVPLDPGSGK